MNATELQDGLRHFTGSESYYRYTFGLKLTEGVKFLADNASNGAYWLLDVIGSHQACTPKVRQHRQNDNFQSWKLKKNDKGGCRVTCDDGNGNILTYQDIEYTDFPLDEFTLYLIGDVILLPSEY
jgi:hypothetical protein